MFIIVLNSTSLFYIFLKFFNYSDVVPVFRKATDFIDRMALQDASATYSYGNLFLAAKDLSERIHNQVEGKIGERVMFLCPNDASYVITQWAIWMAGQIGECISFTINIMLPHVKLSYHRIIVIIILRNKQFESTYLEINSSNNYRWFNLLSILKQSNQPSFL